jgi:drug/metabolite transporter (DMT)-like permease
MHNKGAVAFLLGVFSFFLFMFIGETLMYHYGNAGLFVTFVVMFVYFFACQFFLSRGNPNAYRKDWPIMLALDGIFLLVLIPMALTERREVVIAQGLGILIGCFGATWAGAFVASKRARRKGEQT